MEITPLTIYLWQLADGLKDTVLVMGLLFAVPTLVCAMIGHIEESKRALIGSAFSFVCAMMLFLVGIFTPSSKTIAMMYVIPKLADSEVIKKDVPEMYEMAKEALREYVGKK